MARYSGSFRGVSVLAAMFLMLAAAPTAIGATIFVDDSATGANNGTSWANAYTDLQSALAVAVSGDAIWVAAGIYYPTSDTDRTISFALVEGVGLYGGLAGTEDPATFDLAGRDFDADETVLSGDIGILGYQDDNSYHVVIAADMVAIDGFTIRDGDARAGGVYGGGGVRCQLASLTIANCTITGNRAWASCMGCHGFGGGVYCHTSSLTITNCTITDNIAFGDEKTGCGGGLYCYDSTVTITGCMFTGNIAASASPGDGGGIHFESCSATLTNSTITGNHGHGVYCDSASPTITNCVIAGNVATRGGGVGCGNASMPTITNCAITGNTARYGGGMHTDVSCFPIIANCTLTGNHAVGYSSCVGGGISCAGPATIMNCTIMSNNACSGGGVYCDIDASPTIINTIVAFNTSGLTGDGTPVLQYNCVYGNTEYDYSGIPDPTGVDGNISVDPRFADVTSGNWHIQPDSPCLDTGDSVAVVHELDLDGQPRIQPAGGTVDIGADESDGTLWLAGPYTVVRVSPNGDDANDGSSWLLAKRTVQAGIDAASAAGGEVWVEAGTYYECITLHPFAHVFGGFAGTEVERLQRDLAVNATILDGQQQGPVVAADTGYRTNTLDGFTLVNGSRGVACTGSSPAIANCIITGHSGSGIYCSGASSPMISNCIIARNNATNGGGVDCYYGFPTIADCVITGNHASENGGGVRCANDSTPTIVNCTIAGNSARNGGGVFWYGPSPMITNTIIAFNASGLYVSYSNDAPLLRFNCVYGNKAYDYSGLANPTNVDGNISADPEFVSTAYGDWHIQPDSPCVDAGDNTADIGDVDIDGQPRVTPAGGIVDIGADESDGTPWPAGPNTIVRVSPNGNDASDGSTWALAKRTVQAGIDAASAARGDVWIRAGTYYECITLHAYAHVFGGFAGTETERGERDWNGNLTVLDGQQQNSVVTANAGYQNSTVDGFSIVNGLCQNGGGVACNGGSPTIANCTISDNVASWYGGGVYGGYASCPVITDCMISGNSASSGGGVCSDYVSCPVITNCTIADNSASKGGGVYCYFSSAAIVGSTVTANSAAEGGGIFCDKSSHGPLGSVMTANNVVYSTWPSTSVTITNCAFTGNVASSRGGGVHCHGGSPTITNCAITGNRAASDGGGLYCTSMWPSTASPRITNCAITGNSSSARGGGVHYSNGLPTITNSTITENNASSGGGGICCEYGGLTLANSIVAFNSSGLWQDGGSPISVVQHNCVHGNTAYDYLGMSDPTGTDGNMSIDPGFVQSPDAGPDGAWGTADDDYGDLHLRASSPCIDGGDNAAVPVEIMTDLDGNPRIASGTWNGSAIVDMGVYEFRFRPSQWTDFDGDGDVDLTDFNKLRICFNGPNRPPVLVDRCGEADFDADGDVDLADFTVFARCFNGPNRPPAADCP